MGHKTKICHPLSSLIAVQEYTPRKSNKTGIEVEVLVHKVSNRKKTESSEAKSYDPTTLCSTALLHYLDTPIPLTRVCQSILRHTRTHTLSAPLLHCMRVGGVLTFWVTHWAWKANAHTHSLATDRNTPRPPHYPFRLNTFLESIVQCARSIMLSIKLWADMSF